MQLPPNLDVKNRLDAVLLFEVRDGNPNGDPDAGNAPRIDPETGQGLVSDVALKRKVRDYVSIAHPGRAGYDLFVKVRGVLYDEQARAYEALGVKKDDASKVEQARAWMCRTFFDVRAFGAVMSVKEFNCGQVRGPIQVAFARSIDPITELEQAITRKAVTTRREADEQREKSGQVTGTMGRKSIVPYALYRTHVFFSPRFAHDTGFAQEDLAVFLDALVNLFEHDHSATRAQMSTRSLVVFSHASPLGNAPSASLFDRVQVARRDATRPARDFRDYEVRVEETALPAGVSCHRLV